VKYLVYATRHTPARPPQIPHTQYMPLGGPRAEAKVAFLRLLSAVEKRQTRDGALGWDTPVPALGWELWQVGFVPRPLAAASEEDPAVVVCRPDLHDLLGGERALEELHRWWADSVYAVTYRPASRATTLRTLLPAAAAAGTDPESETRA
jgi:hypothetical protein